MAAMRALRVARRAARIFELALAAGEGAAEHEAGPPDTGTRLVSD